jgi:prolyl-tRNA synthetase
VHSKEELRKSIEHRKLVKMAFCLRDECEEDIKNSCDGATSRCLPFTEQNHVSGKCANCGEDAKAVALFGKNY